MTLIVVCFEYAAVDELRVSGKNGFEGVIMGVVGMRDMCTCRSREDVVGSGVVYASHGRATSGVG